MSVFATLDYILINKAIKNFLTYFNLVLYYVLSKENNRKE